MLVLAVLLAATLSRGLMLNCTSVGVIAEDYFKPPAREFAYGFCTTAFGETHYISPTSERIHELMPGGKTVITVRVAVSAAKNCAVYDALVLEQPAASARAPMPAYIRTGVPLYEVVEVVQAPSVPAQLTRSGDARDVIVIRMVTHALGPPSSSRSHALR